LTRNEKGNFQTDRENNAFWNGRLVDKSTEHANSGRQKDRQNSAWGAGGENKKREQGRERAMKC